MLEMKSKCEQCGTALPPNSNEATICSFECTFCSHCSKDTFGGVCPNCDGELVKRPTRQPREACSVEAIYRGQGPR
jgi:uncharacterized protein